MDGLAPRFAGIDATRLALAARDEKIRRACREDLLEFVRLFWHCNDPKKPLVQGWPLEAMCDHLMACADGHIKRLCMNVPPGSMKSLLTTVFFPAWLWGPMELPHLRFICAAYTASLTIRDNRRFRRVIDDPLYQRLWGHVFALTARGAKKVENDKTGWKLATSVEGVGTGERGNYVLIDDANNPLDVESDTVRDNTNTWLREVMPDRVNDLDEDKIINIQQRTHDADATGTLMKESERGEYTWLCIPAEYDPWRHCATVLEWAKKPEVGKPETGIARRIWEDPRGCDAEGYQLPGRSADGSKVDPGSPIAAKEGELYWPERLSKDALVKLKTIKGPYAASAQYAQLPVPRGGAVFREEWWRLWDRPEYPDFFSLVAWLDTAIKEGEENDYNAFTVMGLFAGDNGMPNIMLRWGWRIRTDLPSLCLKVGNDCQRIGVDYLLIEDKTRGHDCDFEIRRQFRRRNFSTRLMKVDGDKMSRALAVQHIWAGDAEEYRAPDGHLATRWRGGVVWAPNTEWAQDIIDECKKFPRGEHDDWVDCCTGTAGFFRKSGVIYRPIEWMDEQAEAQMFKKPVKPVYDV